ncbi:hypothetical protein D7209_41930 [Burkholderia cepacia]|nr:hypothetical protein [Burkholderia cepacia]
MERNHAVSPTGSRTRRGAAGPAPPRAAEPPPRPAVRPRVAGAYSTSKRSAQRRHGAQTSGIEARQGRDTRSGARRAARKPGPERSGGRRPSSESGKCRQRMRHSDGRACAASER